MGLSSIFALYLGSQALVAFVCICCILANVFVLKQITLFGLNATAADVYSIGATLGLNLLQEYVGRPLARKTIWINFFFLVFYAIVSQFHLLFIPSNFDIMQPAYNAIFSFMPRIIAASFTSYLISQTVDYLLYGAIRQWWKHRYLVLRNYASLIVSQLVDTILFTFLGLYGIISEPWNIIIISYSIKLIAIAIATPFVGLSRSFIVQKNLSDS